MLIPLRLIILELPEPFEDRSEFFVVGDCQGIGWLLSQRFLDGADVVVDGMELIMEIVEHLIDPFAAFCLLGGRFSHTRQVDQCFDAGRTLRLCGKLLGVRVKEITTAACAQ